MADSNEPKKETVRITLPTGVIPNPAEATAARCDTVRIVSASVQMKKTQPLISMPAPRAPVTPVTVAPKEAAPKLDAISMPLCWALLGTSAAILLIQIWNYLS